MKNLLKKLKTLAVAGITTAVVGLGALSAQAWVPPEDYKSYIATDSEYETAHNPFAMPSTMPHWLSNLARHSCWTNYAGGNDGFRPYWKQGNWFIATNRYFSVNEPQAHSEYYNRVQNAYWRLPDGPAVHTDDTCLARIQHAAEDKLAGAGDDDAVGANVTIAICELLRPHEARLTPTSGQHAIVASNYLYSLDTDYRVVRDSSFLGGLRMDGESFQHSTKILEFTKVRQSRNKDVETDVAPTKFVEAFNDHYGAGLRKCITYLDKVPEDWTGTYTLHNRDYETTTVEETVRYVIYDGSTTGIESTTNRTRTVTGPEAWPAFDEDVYLDRGDVLIMKSICYLADSAVQMMRAYKLPGEHSGYRADNTMTNLVELQNDLHMFGYTDHTPNFTNHIYKAGYSDRIEHAIHDLYHRMPTLLESIDDEAALAAARTAYVNGLASFLDADAFITGKTVSKTGKSITGKRNLDQLHLIEFEESEEGGGEWNFTGWREFAEKTYASLINQGTEAAVQTIDLVDIGKKLDIHAGSQGNASAAQHGTLDFSKFGKNRDGKVSLDMNAIFDGKITRNSVILDGGLLTTNGPARWVKTRYSTFDGGRGYKPGDQVPIISKDDGHVYWYFTMPECDAPERRIQRLHMAFDKTTVSPTLNGLYPSGTLLDDLAVMKAQFPADGAENRAGFAQMVDVVNCERKEIVEDTVVDDGAYAASASKASGGAFAVSSDATLTGGDLAFTGNSAPQGGAIYNDGEVVMNGTFTLATDGDTIQNNGTLEWNLKDGNRGCLKGYDKLTNNGTLMITVDDAFLEKTNITIAAGDISSTTGKDTFTVKHGDDELTLKIGGEVTSKDGLSIYKLAIEESEESGEDKLVFTVSPMPKVAVADVDNATWVAYTNDVPLTGEQPYAVEPNAVVSVVYTAKGDYMFPGGYRTLTTNVTASAALTTVTLTAEQQPVAAAACEECLTFSAEDNFGIRMWKKGTPPTVNLEYSTDKTYWETFDKDAGAAAGADRKLYLRGTGNTAFASSPSAYYAFTNTADSAETAIACSGNIETLLDYQTVAKGEHPTMGNYAFSNLFQGFEALTAAPELPATTLASDCYNGMFMNCVSLKTAPELPATNLADYCYAYMFITCASLKEAPKLPAMTLADNCYDSMFAGCSSLTAAPELPSTNLASYCYYYMFQNCKSLTAAPELPATNLASYCYSYMFQDCTSLTTVPELPATTLGSNCYESMFRGCKSLVVNTNAPGKEWSIPAEAETSAASASNWNKNMFKGTSGDITNTTVTCGEIYYVRSALVPVTVEVPEVAGATAQLYTFYTQGGWTSVATNEVPSNATVRVVWTAAEGKGLNGEGAANAFQWMATFVADKAVQTVPAPEVVAAGESTIDIGFDSRETKRYYDAAEIMPVWYAAGTEVKVKGDSQQSWKTIVRGSAATNTVAWAPKAADVYTLTQNELDDAKIYLYVPVTVTTNNLEVTDTAVEKVTVSIEGKDEDLPADGTVPSNSVVTVVYAVVPDGKYFMDGTRTYKTTFVAGKAVNAASEMIEKPEAPQEPSVKLGMVAQRYPWNGMLDVQYWAKNTPNEGYAITVTITLPDGTKGAKTLKASETHGCRNGKNVTEFNVREAFGEVQALKGVKVRATLEKAAE